eukprot:8351938-Pyramimonas_sp.AAC.1
MPMLARSGSFERVRKSKLVPEARHPSVGCAPPEEARRAWGSAGGARQAVRALDWPPAARAARRAHIRVSRLDLELHCVVCSII